jgi:xanthine dehydrogenase accessory factor
MTVFHLSELIILIKGAGEKASAVAHHLRQYGFKKIVMTDLRRPLAERRGVSFCEAILDGRKEVDGVTAQRTDCSLDEIFFCWEKERIPILADPETQILDILRPHVLIDAIMAKRNTGTFITAAPLVIALGPGFVVGVDTHQVIETNPDSPYLGRLITNGSAEQETGIPTSILGLTLERLIISPGEGILHCLKTIGDKVEKSELIALVDDLPVLAGIPGVIWGQVRDGIKVKANQKIGDIDPRGERKFCFEITPQARLIADGVLKGILDFFHLKG